MDDHERHLGDEFALGETGGVVRSRRPTSEPEKGAEKSCRDAGFFSVDKLTGWQVLTSGTCTTFAFLLPDPRDHMRQIFYFGTVGPVYTCQEQKDLDAWYVANGGFPHTWLDAPVVDPLTPENDLAHWPDIADLAAAIEFLPYTATPGGGTAYGHIVCGVTAGKGDFSALAERLVASLNSFRITQSYVDDCLDQSAQIWGAVAAAGQTLSEASDIIWDGWTERTHSQDISAEQWTDAYRGVERVYDPATGTVFEVPNGWYEAYDLDRDADQMSGLQPMPAADWDAWMQAVLDGLSQIH